MSELLIPALAGSLMLAGLLGLFLPVLPDLPLMWLGALVFGLFGEWGRWGPYIFATITLLAGIGVVAEVWASGVGARLGGASLWGVLAGLVFGAAGLLFLGPLGAVGGLLLGTFVVELIRQKDSRLAARGTLGMGVGYGASFVIKLGLSLVVIGLWVLWLFLV